MQRAIELAARGAGHTAPNPMVGAVVVRDGEVVGEGWHAHYGDAHAEVVALRAAGDAARGATVYVSLEPCNHTGQTPPCTEALMAAGVRRVVFAVHDPNPVAAGGAERLRAAGIEVSGGVESIAATELNAPFLFAARGATRPFVTLKLAMSIDGAIVDATRQRGWLTGPEARVAVHALRARADAIGVGIGTALGDDPALTVREAPAPRVPPIRIVFDRRARLPLDSVLVQTAREVPVVVVAGEPNAAQRARETDLAAAGVNTVHAPDLGAALHAIRELGVRHLVVEGGATIGSALVANGLVDRLITFQAPVILGADALPAFAALPARTASTAPRLRVISREVLGADLMTTYAVSGD